jgi:hypothetical protein
MSDAGVSGAGAFHVLAGQRIALPPLRVLGFGLIFPRLYEAGGGVPVWIRLKRLVSSNRGKAPLPTTPDCRTLPPLLPVLHLGLLQGLPLHVLGRVRTPSA